MEEMLKRLNAENVDETMEDVREYTENDLKFWKTMISTNQTNK